LALGVRECLSRMAIDDRQDPERTSVEQAVGHEVHRPDLVCTADRGPPLSVAPGPFALGQLGPDRQSLVPVDPASALVIHLPALPAQQDVQPPVAIAHPCGSELLQPHAQSNLRVGALPVTLGRAAETGGLAGPALADVVGHLQVTGDLAASGGPHHFRLSTSCSMERSSVRSATSRLSLLFSSSNCYSRWISGTPMPTNCFFQR
jgi:hypothetical protein